MNEHKYWPCEKRWRKCHLCQSERLIVRIIIWKLLVIEWGFRRDIIRFRGSLEKENRNVVRKIFNCRKIIWEVKDKIISWRDPCQPEAVSSHYKKGLSIRGDPGILKTHWILEEVPTEEDNLHTTTWRWGCQCLQYQLIVGFFTRWKNKNSCMVKVTSRRDKLHLSQR